MLRLLKGDNVDLLMLARNVGTSVDQLERFYLSHADPAMKVENLQSYKAKSQPDYDDDEELPEVRSASPIQVGVTMAEPEVA